MVKEGKKQTRFEWSGKQILRVKAILSKMIRIVFENIPEGNGGGFLQKNEKN